MKRLERTPASLPPPDPNVILCNLPWLSHLDQEALNTVQTHALLMQFEHGDIIIQQGEEATGIYIIVSGLVKVSHMIPVSYHTLPIHTVMLDWPCTPTHISPWRSLQPHL